MISKLYKDKNKPILANCVNKNVLDLGIVDHDARYEQKKGWLHGDLKRISKKIMGIDIDEKSIKILKQKEYDVIARNVENFDLKEKFDVVVAGDLIEHLDNVGNFLKCVKKHMRKDSLFILTTPNCLSLSNWIELLIFGKIKFINEQHTHWYDENTIKRILKNHDFKIEELSFIIHNPHFIEESRSRYLLKNMRHSIHAIFCSIRKQFAPTIFVKAKLGEK